jgi:type II secretory pathway pseudopilin PulG
MEEHKENTEEIKINHDNTPDKPNKSGKGLTVALVIVIILAITAIVGTWYYMSNKAKNDKKAQDAQIQQLQKQVDDLKANETSVADQQDITEQVKAMYKYWIDGKEKDYSYLLKNNYITQEVFDQSKNKSYDLVSCSQNTLLKSTDYQYSTPEVVNPTSATMKVSGTYSGPPASTTVISLDLTKVGNIWKVNKITCPAL